MKSRTAHDDGASPRRPGSVLATPEAPFEMANLRPKNTGLPMVIWVSERGRARHAPRIKVSLRHGPKIDIEQTVSVTIEDSPKVIGGELGSDDYDAVRSYIARNIPVLLAYWNGELDTLELLDQLKPIGGGRSD